MLGTYSLVAVLYSVAISVLGTVHASLTPKPCVGANQTCLLLCPIAHLLEGVITILQSVDGHGYE